ncbi:hypothetical protein MYTO111405_01430 [Mycoplasma todarodis]
MGMHFYAETRKNLMFKGFWGGLNFNCVNMLIRIKYEEKRFFIQGILFNFVDSTRFHNNTKCRNFKLYYAKIFLGQDKHKYLFYKKR